MTIAWLGFPLCPLVLFAQGATSSPQSRASTQPALTNEEKLELHVKRIVSPGVFIRAGLVAAEQQWRNDPEEWKQGAAGFGRRYASSVGSTAVRNALAFGLDSALHEDPRFYPSKRRGFWPRTKDALVQTFVCHDDDGGKTIAVWRIGSAYGAGLISNVWRPDSVNTVGDGLVRGTLILGVDALTNEFKEFWPDIRRKLRRK